MEIQKSFIFRLVIFHCIQLSFWRLLSKTEDIFIRDSIQSKAAPSPKANDTWPIEVPILPKN